MRAADYYAVRSKLYSESYIQIKEELCWQLHWQLSWQLRSMLKGAIQR